MRASGVPQQQFEGGALPTRGSTWPETVWTPSFRPAQIVSVGTCQDSLRRPRKGGDNLPE